MVRTVKLLFTGDDRQQHEPLNWSDLVAHLVDFSNISVDDAITELCSDLMSDMITFEWPSNKMKLACILTACMHVSFLNKYDPVRWLKMIEVVVIHQTHWGNRHVIAGHVFSVALSIYWPVITAHLLFLAPGFDDLCSQCQTRWVLHALVHLSKTSPDGRKVHPVNVSVTSLRKLTGRRKHCKKPWWELTEFEIWKWFLKYLIIVKY